MCSRCGCDPCNIVGYPRKAPPAACDANPQPPGVAGPGIALAYSRCDHVHPAQAVPVACNTNPLADGVAAPGVAVEYSRCDHVHPAAAPAGGDWVLIEDKLLAADGAIQFLAIPQTFKHLVIIASLRGSGVLVQSEFLYLRLNADATGVYDSMRSSLTSLATTNADFFAATQGHLGFLRGAMDGGAGSEQPSWTPLHVWFPDYAATKQAAWVSDGYLIARFTAGFNIRTLTGGRRDVAAATTQIDLLASASVTFLAGSRATLYGVK